MRNIRALLLIVVSIAILSLASCSKPQQPQAAAEVKKFTVTFMVDGSVYRTLAVNADTRASEPENPVFADPSRRFVEWQTEEGKSWNFKLGIVSKDMTLYASYRTVSLLPSELKMADKSLASSLSWTQGQLSSSYKVTIKDSSGAIQVLEGKAELDEALSKVTFTPKAAIQGGLYEVEVATPEGSVTAKDLLFCGNGTPDNPYLVASAKDFEALSQADVPEGTVFSLYANITLESFRAFQQGFTFNGTLLGNGRTITLQNANCGAFYKIGEKGKVSKLNLAGAISTVKDSVGALADFNAGLIENVTTTAQVESTAGLVGSINLKNALDQSAEDGKRGIAGLIVGTNEASGVIRGCKIATESTTTGRMIANIAGGGIAGYNMGLIADCTGEVIVGGANAILSSKSLSKYSYAGGIAGINAGVIERCSLAGSSKLLAQRYLSADAVVEGTNNSCIGGIAGYNTASGSIRQCSFTGIRVHGDESVGGIAGSNEGLIEACLVAGTLHEINTDFTRTTYIAGRINVGGIAGLDTGKVKDCAVSANVLGFTKDAPAYYISASSLNGAGLPSNPDGQAQGALGLTAAIVSDYGASGESYSEPDNLSALVYPPSYVGLKDAVTMSSAFAISGDQLILGWTSQAAEEQSIEVELIGSDGSLFALARLAETPSSLEEPYNIGKQFNGWSLALGGDVVIAPGAKLSLYDVSSYAGPDGKIRLYASESGKVYEAKVKVAVWGRYLSLEGLEALKQSAEAYVNGAYELEWAYFDDAAYHAVAAFGAAVNEASDFSMIVGSGTNISTTGGVSAVTKGALRADIATLEAGRQAAMLSDSSYAMDLYGWLTGIEDASAQVALYPEVDSFQTLSSIMGNSINGPLAQSSIGWADKADAKAPAITDEKITYESVKALLVDGKVVLYPVFAASEPAAEPQAEASALKVAVWTKDGGWVTEAEMARIAQRYAAALIAEGLDITKIEFIVDIITTEGNKVADLGARTNEGSYDIIVGCGNNVNSTAGVSIIKKAEIPLSAVASGRMVALLKENSLASRLYDLLLAEDDGAPISLKVAVWTKDGEWVTKAELDEIKKGFAALVNGTGLQVDYVEITSPGNKVADLGKLTNEGAFDIVIGAGNNIDSSAGVVIIEKADIKASLVAAARKAALLTDNAFARLMYSYLK